MATIVDITLTCSSLTCPSHFLESNNISFIIFENSFQLRNSIRSVKRSYIPGTDSQIVGLNSFAWEGVVIKIGRYPRHIFCFHWNVGFRGSSQSQRTTSELSPFAFATPLTGVSIVPKVHHEEDHNAFKVHVIVAYDIRIDLMWVNKDNACFTKLNL